MNPAASTPPRSLASRLALPRPHGGFSLRAGESGRPPPSTRRSAGASVGAEQRRSGRCHETQPSSTTTPSTGTSTGIPARRSHASRHRSNVGRRPPRVVMHDPELPHSSLAREIGHGAGVGVPGLRGVLDDRLLLRQPDLVQQQLNARNEIDGGAIHHRIGDVGEPIADANPDRATRMPLTPQPQVERSDRKLRPRIGKDFDRHRPPIDRHRKERRREQPIERLRAPRR